LRRKLHHNERGRRINSDCDSDCSERDANDGNCRCRKNANLQRDSFQRQCEQRRDLGAFLRNGERLRFAFGDDERIGNGGDLHRAGDRAESSDGYDHGDIRERQHEIRLRNDRDWFWLGPASASFRWSFGHFIANRGDGCGERDHNLHSDGNGRFVKPRRDLDACRFGVWRPFVRNFVVGGQRFGYADRLYGAGHSTESGECDFDGDFRRRRNEKRERDD